MHSGASRLARTPQARWLGHSDVLAGGTRPRAHDLPTLHASTSNEGSGCNAHLQLGVSTIHGSVAGRILKLFALLAAATGGVAWTLAPPPSPQRTPPALTAFGTSPPSPPLPALRLVLAKLGPLAASCTLALASSGGGRASALLPLIVATLPGAEAGKRRKPHFHAYFSPQHGAAVFSTWEECSKWACGSAGSCAYHRGGFASAEDAAAAAATAGGHGTSVAAGLVPVIITDAPPAHIAAPGTGAAAWNGPALGNGQGCSSDAAIEEAPLSQDPAPQLTPPTTSVPTAMPPAEGPKYKRQRRWDAGANEVQTATAGGGATGGAPPPAPAAAPAPAYSETIATSTPSITRTPTFSTSATSIPFSSRSSTGTTIQSTGITIC